jgi:hypothetical protein
MIRVSLTLLVFLYLGLFLLAVFGIWIVFECKRQLRERRSTRFRVRCSICAFEFEDATEEQLPRCPRCGCLNERRHISLL